MLFGETDESHPFVEVEQMMPFLPFVRCRNVDEAIEKARRSEHGFRHTAIIHSNNVRNMTKMGKAMDTTLFIKNGPSMAGLGLGGEGYCSFSIAGPTGEGRHHAVDIHPRTSLFDDRRSAHSGKVSIRCLGKRSRLGRGLVHFSAGNRVWRNKRRPKTWTCPLSRARGTVPFSRRERQFSCDVLSAAKIGTVPCERLRYLAADGTSAIKE